MSVTKKKPVNRFNFVMLNIPTSQCIIHINYSFFFYTIWRKQNRQKEQYTAVNKRKKKVVKNVMKRKINRHSRHN